MKQVVFDAAELVKQYRGERGIVEGEACPKCSKLGVLNPVYYYRDIRRKKGRCFSCYHIEGNKPTSQQREFMELPNGDRVYEGKRCSSCQKYLRIFDAETGERLGLSGKAKVNACYHCARMKQSTLEPAAAHRDFLDDVKRAVWKFTIRSVEASGVVEVAARDGYERAQIKQLLATSMMMNRHAELADKPERYEVDHYYPAAGEGDNRGMTNIANLRIIRSDENRSKRDDIPTSYAPDQVLNIADLSRIISYRQASEALKRWYAEGDKASDYTPERQAVYTRKQEALKADIEAIETRLGEDFCRSVYAAVDAEENSLFDVLRVAQNKLRRYKAGGNQKLVEAYKKRLAIHGNRGFVKVEPPDLAAMAYIGKGAVLWAVEATVSNVVDGITLLMERGMTAEEQRLTDAIAYDCVGWAVNAMDSKNDVMPFVSPLLAVFGEKIFAVRQKYGKYCLTVYDNTRKGQLRKMLDADGSISFSGREDPDQTNPIGNELLSAADSDVLERMALFDNETLSIQRQKQAAADARAEAIRLLREQAGRLLVASGEAMRHIENEWLKLVALAEQRLCDPDADSEDNAAVMGFFSKQWRHEFDTEKSRQQQFMTLCREFVHVPFSEPAEAKEAYQKLVAQQPAITSLPEPFKPEPIPDEQERERLRLIAERMEREDAEKKSKRDADKRQRADKAAFMRSPAGQEWLRNQKKGHRKLTPHGVSRDNRKH
ncbi:hypothetical protein D4E36_23645 [Salmonella enterica subsp. enterica serovar Virchow]|nr:hypothetical protein [Salmonella enterica subsp. enterica serovar Virchow]